MKIKTLNVLALAGLLLAGGTWAAFAQSSVMVAHAISAGGGTSSNALLTLTGTIGQWATGTLNGGDLTVNAGFWGAIDYAPPLAGDVTIERYPTLGTKVLVTTLLASDRDPDGGALSLAVSPTSASDATITLSGGWVYYTPLAGFTNADSFTYTVTDSFGGRAVGTVTVAIYVDNNPGQDVTITNLGHESLLLISNGIPGYTYTLQYSDVAAPFVWQALGSVNANSAGVFQFTDAPGVETMRFYRWVYP